LVLQRMMIVLLKNTKRPPFEVAFFLFANPDLIGAEPALKRFKIDSSLRCRLD